MAEELWAAVIPVVLDNMDGLSHSFRSLHASSRNG